MNFFIITTRLSRYFSYFGWVYSYVFCSEGNFLCAIIGPSFVAFLMDPNMMFWHKKLVPRHCPSSGLFIQKTVNTSAGGYLQFGRAIWRFFLCI